MLKIWINSALENARLYQEMQEVILLRILKLARGNRASHVEAHRLLTEKGIAFAEAASSLAQGASMKKVTRRYRSYVRANKRRLSRYC
jgi:hypothetical protein